MIGGVIGKKETDDIYDHQIGGRNGKVKIYMLYNGGRYMGEGLGKRKVGCLF